MGLVGTLVVAGLLSATTYVRSEPMQAKGTLDLVEVDIAGSTFPALPSYNLDPDIAHNLGAYGPRYAVPSKIPSKVPTGCNVKMISILQRHGARYPTKGSGSAITATLTKLKAVQNITASAFQFVPNYTFPFTSADIDQLVPFGRSQSYISGQIIAKKYAALGTAKFVRASLKDRILESSRWWIQGFEGSPYNVAIANLPAPNVTIPIGPTSNNTMNPQTCTADEALDPAPGEVADITWLATFAPPVTRRLNKYLPGANLTNDDIPNLMSLCGFDTAYRNGSASPWCYVFSKSEWKDYEYYHDLEKYYSNSYGSPYGRSIGAGWVNELIARLTDTPVHDNTTTNSTLDSNPATFPIGPSAPSIFADFSSDTNIAKILSALGILRDTKNLPPTGPIPSNQLFVVAKLVPFAGLTVVEKISCPATRAAIAGGDYVRIIVNDAVAPLNFPACGSLGSVSGLCPVDKFVESQAFARAGGNFTACFANVTSASGST
ncbi:phosphoglycerate mutase-like protein [Ceratobasidium sp. AG-I]|nr:phosphoglycerate mutase-like protein [Ceratobasidium sp. AG-I]